jgi:hypothetical protein
MKHKLMKKATAAALALSIIGSVVPTVITANAAGEEVTLSSVNVFLEDSISLRFYATKDSVDEANVTSVSLDGPNKDLKIAKTDFEATAVNGDDYYVFTYPLYATQLNENVTIEFLDSNNSIISIKNKDDSFSYKINDYYDYILNPENGYTKGTIDAVTSLKNLGLAADNYFKDSGNSIDFIDTKSDTKTALKKYEPNFTSEEGKISLVLNSNISARLYIDGLTVGTPSEEHMLMTFYAIKGQNGKACFELKHLFPRTLRGTYEIKYKDKIYKFSALSFCSRAINSNNKKTSDIAEAVYEYHKYVSKYQDTYTVTLLQEDTNKLLRFDFEPGCSWSQLADSIGDENILGCSGNNVWVLNDNTLLYFNTTEGYTAVNPNDLIATDKDYRF